MAFAQGEQFHRFAGKILVGMLLAALRLVEPDEHRRVPARLNQQAQPIVGGQAAEQLVLPPHEIIGIARTFSMLVAKWPCQNKTIFSWNGRGPFAMRFSHQPRSSTICWAWARCSACCAIRFASGGRLCIAFAVPPAPDPEPPKPDWAWGRGSFRSRAARRAPRRGRGPSAWRFPPAARQIRRGLADVPQSHNSSHPLEVALAYIMYRR